MKKDRIRRALAFTLAAISSTAVVVLALPVENISMTSPTQAGGPGFTETISITSANGDLFARTAVGDFDGDLLQDIVVAGPTEIHLGGSVGLHRWWVNAGVGANDVAFMPNTGLPADLFLAAQSNGVVCYGNVTSTGLVPMVLNADAEWLDTAFLDAVDLGEGLPRIVGIPSDLRRLWTLCDDGTGAYLSAEIVLSAPLIGDAKELAIVDFGVEPFIVVATDPALQVYSFGGGAVVGYAFPGESTTALAVGTQAGGGDWMAWTTIDGAGAERLRVFDGTGLASSVDLPSGAGVVGLSTGDWSGDGSDELAVNLAGKDRLWILDNAGATRPAFDKGRGNKSVVPYTGHRWNVAQPAFADLESDGDIDVFLPLQSDDTVGVLHNDGIDPSELVVEINVDPADFGDPFAAPGCPGGSPNGAVVLTFDVDVPDLPATDLQITVWTQPDIGGLAAPSSYKKRVGVTPDETNQVQITFEPAIPPASCAEAEVFFAELYYFELRLMRIEGGAVTKSMPPEVYGIEIEDRNTGTANFTYLQSLKVPGSTTYKVIATQGVRDPEEVGSVNLVTNIPLPPGTVVRYGK